MNSENGLGMVPAVLRAAGASESAVFRWLRIDEPVPALGRFVRRLRTQGVAEALDEYRRQREDRPTEPALGEGTLNRIGYALLRDQRTQDAVKVFELNVEEHPESWNVHDSLGEALAAAGDTARAIAEYERSVQLNPANAGGLEALKKLRSASAPRN
jgi:tetratricopeptide (TPR) repeat protein